MKRLYFIGIGLGFFGFIIVGMTIAEIWIGITDFFKHTKYE